MLPCQKQDNNFMQGKIKGRDFLDLKCIWIIPLSPKSDQYQHAISPYNIAIESNVKVMRVKKLITK